jgi:hypothetical protein
MKRPVLASVLVVTAAVLVVALISTRKEQAVEMNMALIKAIAALVPAGMLFAGSVVLYCRSKAPSSLLQLLGAGCLVIVVLTHVCEALGLFPWMHWGLQGSVGHFLDFWSATLGLVLFPAGYLLHALTS